ncbi:MAG TPA: DUF3592 domain-containing protein [Candidatus Methylacidiphilales bacterium]|nr:DUF3592 domain-containing protein [Candidatus Methylacidiphilales bacterium]
MSAKPSHQHQRQPYRAGNQPRRGDFTAFHLEGRPDSGLGSLGESRRREKEKQRSLEAATAGGKSPQRSSNMSSRKKSRAGEKDSTSATGYAVLTIFGLLWISFMCFADWMVLTNMAKQAMSYTYVPVTARVVSSSVETRSTDEGNTYSPKIEYTYQYNNISHTGSVVRFSALTTGDSNSRDAKEFVRQRPEGAEITAWVDASRPYNAVLERGLRGSDLFVLLFFVPFNMVSLAFLWMFRELWLTRNSALAGIGLEETAHGFRVEVSRKNVFLCFIGTLGITGFIGIFAVLLIGGKGFNPSVNLMAGTWTVILCLTLYSVLHTAWSNYSGIYDLEVDTLHGTLIVPSSTQSYTRRTYSLQDPMAIVLRRVEKSDSESSTTTYYIEFSLQDADQRVLITEMQVSDAAKAFAEWLSKKLGIPLKHKWESK